MNGYEKLIKTMRTEAKRGGKGIDLKIGVMSTPTSCTIGQIELDSDDLYVAEHLTKKSLTDLNINILTSDNSIQRHEWEDLSKYLSPLKEGDVVLIARISNEKYAIIEKLVEVS